MVLTLRFCITNFIILQNLRIQIITHSDGSLIIHNHAGIEDPNRKTTVVLFSPSVLILSQAITCTRSPCACTLIPSIGKNTGRLCGEHLNIVGYRLTFMYVTKRSWVTRETICANISVGKFMNSVQRRSILRSTLSFIFV